MTNILTGPMRCYAEPMNVVIPIRPLDARQGRARPRHTPKGRQVQPEARARVEAMIQRLKSLEQNA